MTAPVIFTLSPNLPDEWFDAHGCRRIRGFPLGMTPALPPIPAGICDTVAAVQYLSTCPEIAGIVITSGCDQMRHAVERIHSEKIFLFNMPSVCMSGGATMLYADELRRMGIWLTQRSGIKPNETRSLTIASSHARERLERCIQADEAVTPHIPVALVGGPIIWEKQHVIKYFQSLGLEMMLDATENGERHFWVEPSKAGIADTYAGAGCVPDPFRRPNDRFYLWLAERIRCRKIAALILIRTAWCDQWRGVLPRLKTELKIPVIEWVIDLSGGLPDARTKTRLEALAESLGES